MFLNVPQQLILNYINQQLHGKMASFGGLVVPTAPATRLTNANCSEGTVFFETDLDVPKDFHEVQRTRRLAVRVESSTLLHHLSSVLGGTILHTGWTDAFSDEGSPSIYLDRSYTAFVQSVIGASIDGDFIVLQISVIDEPDAVPTNELISL